MITDPGILSMRSVIQCMSIAEIVDNYDTFIVDQWGVLHDGLSGFLDAKQSLQYLKRRGKLVAVLTNSGKSGENNLQRLSRYGFNSDAFDLLLTSGDIAIEYINDSWPHRRIYLVDYTPDSVLRTRLKHNSFVTKIDEADFILLSGWNDSMDWKTYESIFVAAAQNGLPMLCSNPDTIGFFQGKAEEGPGAIAARFSQMGGSVTLFGKPDKSFFEVCLARLGKPDKRRSIVIGDSYATDICGAANTGIDSMLIEMGLHRDKFSTVDVMTVIRQLSASFSGSTVYPTYVMADLRA
jgi:HAD superfamily hydrolase (TIGR01459 family)